MIEFLFRNGIEIFALVVLIASGTYIFFLDKQLHRLHKRIHELEAELGKQQGWIRSGPE